jgi:hypothetical protein
MREQREQETERESQDRILTGGHRGNRDETLTRIERFHPDFTEENEANEEDRKLTAGSFG